MTEAMPFLQKAILLSYAPRSFGVVVFLERVTRLELATSTLARWRSTR